MCGIAGYSFGPRSRVSRTLAAQALLAGIAERGADAAGYAFRSSDRVAVHKQRTGASGLLDGMTVPDTAGEVLVHVRDFTKGHPTILANNHPIRHGRVVGIHNGIIANEEPEMTVDSEAIFALVESFGTSPETLGQLVGAMAAAWLDEREPGALHLARGVGRPLWIARGRHELLFASTRTALEVAEDALRTTFLKSQVEEGRLLRVVEGTIEAERRWSPDTSFRESRSLPAVRAPHEGRSCLELLSALVAPA